MKVHPACKVRVQMIDTKLPTKTPRSENAKKSKNEEKENKLSYHHRASSCSCLALQVDQVHL